MIGDLSRSSFSEWQRQKDCSKLKNSCRFIKKKRKEVYMFLLERRGEKKPDQRQSGYRAQMHLVLLLSYCEGK